MQLNNRLLWRWLVSGNDLRSDWSCETPFAPEFIVPIESPAVESFRKTPRTSFGPHAAQLTLAKRRVARVLGCRFYLRVWVPHVSRFWRHGIPRTLPPIDYFSNTPFTPGFSVSVEPPAAQSLRKRLNRRALNLNPISDEFDPLVSGPPCHLPPVT